MRRASVVALFALLACTTEVTVEGSDHDEGEDVFLSDPDLPDRMLFAAGATVGDVARTACSTAGVKPLAQQLLAEVNCLRPDTLTSIATIPGVSLGAGALPQLNVGAARGLRAANRGEAITISSSTRATAQQYVLYYWYQHGRCTSVVSLAAKPGRSNHESGVAIDVPSYSAWKSRLTAQGFRWLGASDVVHFDYQGAGAVDIRSLAVKAFQRLWNRNHPSDRIAEDGVWGDATASRMDRAPAGGFAIGPSCSGDATPTPPPTPTPTPAIVSLTGVIYEGSDTSARVAGATVTVGPRSTTASADGVYTLTGLPTGAVTITASKSGYTTATVDRVLATGVDNWGSVSLTRASGATGRLVGVIYRGADTTSRIGGATVRLSTGQTATADATGLYTFPAVGAGAVTITASKSGFTTRSVTRTVAAATENWGSIGLSTGAALIDECGDVTAAGTCDGAIVSHCDGGRLVQVDCAASGQTCGIDADAGYADCQ
ncbi:MAG: D-alanyl-D-alanine carboxypeptidase family protein [Myxococcales bacterium]|nr:D-alanyl-D-alanine carboxypeptidase family protein [Myxococcales bacterium]